MPKNLPPSLPIIDIPNNLKPYIGYQKSDPSILAKRFQEDKNTPQGNTGNKPNPKPLLKEIIITLEKASATNDPKLTYLILMRLAGRSLPDCSSIIGMDENIVEGWLDDLCGSMLHQSRNNKPPPEGQKQPPAIDALAKEALAKIAATTAAPKPKGSFFQSLFSGLSAPKPAPLPKPPAAPQKPQKVRAISPKSSEMISPSLAFQLTDFQEDVTLMQRICNTLEVYDDTQDFKGAATLLARAGGLLPDEIDKAFNKGGGQPSTTVEIPTISPNAFGQHHQKTVS